MLKKHHSDAAHGKEIAMTLPDAIYGFFTNLVTGVLNPILSGLAYVAPVLLTIMLIGNFIYLFFAQRKMPVFGSFLLLLVIYIYLGMFPELLNLIQSWFVPGSTVDLSNATDAYNSGIQDGYNAIQNTK